MLSHVTADHGAHHFLLLFAGLAVGFVVGAIARPRIAAIVSRILRREVR